MEACAFFDDISKIVQKMWCFPNILEKRLFFQHFCSFLWSATRAACVYPKNSQQPPSCDETHRKALEKVRVTRAMLPRHLSMKRGYCQSHQGSSPTRSLSGPPARGHPRRDSICRRRSLDAGTRVFFLSGVDWVAATALTLQMTSFFLWRYFSPPCPVVKTWYQTPACCPRAAEEEQTTHPPSSDPVRSCSGAPFCARLFCLQN